MYAGSAGQGIINFMHRRIRAATVARRGTPDGRHTWRSGVRSAMCAASQLSGRGPTDVDVAPVPAR